jgi:hypothetical protein
MDLNGLTRFLGDGRGGKKKGKGVEESSIFLPLIVWEEDLKRQKLTDTTIKPSSVE